MEKLDEIRGTKTPRPPKRFKHKFSDLDFIMGSKFKERTGLDRKWITDAEWTEHMMLKKKSIREAEQEV